MTLQSFVPKDQDEKLAIIDDASFFLRNTLNPDQVEPETDAGRHLGSNRKRPMSCALRRADSDTARPPFRHAVSQAPGNTGKASQLPETNATRLVAPLVTDLRQVRSLLMAEHVTIETFPRSEERWVSADGLNRLEVAPSGDGNDNTTLERFRGSRAQCCARAAGKPVFVIEAAATIVKALFRPRSGPWRRSHSSFHCVAPLDHVALTLVPLLVAIVVTLEICVVIGCS